MAWVATPDVVTVNVPVVWPSGIVNDAGTTAEGMSLDAARTTPPGPAGPLRVTVAVEEVPAYSVDGSRLIEFIDIASIVRVVVAFESPSAAVMSALVEAFTLVVVMLKVAVDSPGLMVIGPTTCAAGLSLEI